MTTVLGTPEAVLDDDIMSSSATLNTDCGTISTISIPDIDLSGITLPSTVWSTTSGSYTLNDSYNFNPAVNIDNDGIKINNGADIIVNGKSLSSVIESIESRLAILHPNKELESKWEELKELGEKYRELEKELFEKEKMWDILKKA